MLLCSNNIQELSEEESSMQKLGFKHYGVVMGDSDDEPLNPEEEAKRLAQAKKEQEKYQRMVQVVNERIQNREDKLKSIRQTVSKMGKLSKKEDVSNLDYLDARINDNLISKLPY